MKTGMDLAASSAQNPDQASNAAGSSSAVSSTASSTLVPSQTNSTKVKASELNSAYVRIFKSIMDGHIEECCNPLIGYGQTDDRKDTFGKRVATAFGRAPVTTIVAIPQALKQQNNPIKNLVDAFTSAHFNHDVRSANIANPIKQSQHFILNSIRDMVLKIEHNFPAESDPDRCRSQYLLVRDLCETIPISDRWDNSLFSSLFGGEKQRAFVDLLQQIKNLAESKIYKLDLAKESEQLKLALNKISQHLEGISGAFRSFLLHHLGGAKTPVPGDLFDQEGNVTAFAKVAEALDKKTILTPDEMKALYADFRNDKAVQPTALAFIDNHAKLITIVSLFFNNYKDQKLNELDRLAINKALVQLKSEARSADETSNLGAGQAQIQQESTSSSSTALMPAQDFSRLLASNDEMRSVTEGYKNLQDQSSIIIQNIESCLPPELRKVLSSSKHSTQYEATRTYVAWLKCALTLNMSLLNSKGMINHARQLVVGLGNITKVVAAPQLDKLRTTTKNTCLRIAEAIVMSSRSRATAQRHYALGDVWLNNGLTINALGTNTCREIHQNGILLSLSEMDHSLEPASILADTEKTLGAFTGLNGRLEQIEGYHTEASSFLQILVDVHRTATLASDNQKRLLAETNPGQHYDQLMLRSASSPALLLPANPADPINAERLEAAVVASSPLKGNLRIGQILQASLLPAENGLYPFYVIDPQSGEQRYALTEDGKNWIEHQHSPIRDHSRSSAPLALDVHAAQDLVDAQCLPALQASIAQSREKVALLKSELPQRDRSQDASAKPMLPGLWKLLWIAVVPALINIVYAGLSSLHRWAYAAEIEADTKRFNEITAEIPKEQAQQVQWQEQIAQINARQKAHAEVRVAANEAAKAEANKPRPKPAPHVMNGHPPSASSAPMNGHAAAAPEAKDLSEARLNNAPQPNGQAFFAASSPAVPKSEAQIKAQAALFLQSISHEYQKAKKATAELIPLKADTELSRLPADERTQVVAAAYKLLGQNPPKPTSNGPRK